MRQNIEDAELSQLVSTLISLGFRYVQQVQRESDGWSLHKWQLFEDEIPQEMFLSIRWKSETDLLTKQTFVQLTGNIICTVEGHRSWEKSNIQVEQWRKQKGFTQPSEVSFSEANGKVVALEWVLPTATWTNNGILQLNNVRRTLGRYLAIKVDILPSARAILSV